jgi:subtilisin family serine protease
MIDNFFKTVIISLILISTGCHLGRSNSTPELIDEETDQTIQSEPYYKYAWHFAYNPDFSQQIDKDANIHIEDAWKITKGENVTVAVIDAGDFDINHADLRENVIDVYNADNNNHQILDLTDEPAHGSTVAGFIASPINGEGLIGSAPKAKLILIQQVYDTDSGTIEAFKYAKEQGAKIINNSWGTNRVSQVVADYIQELKDEGITIIFASGNEGANMDEAGINDESELESVIGVGASNESNDVTSYSNYGRNIDILAPGGEQIGLLGIDDTGIEGNSNQLGIVNDDYAFEIGTSFSAPIVTGVAALMLSINPSLTPDQVRDILINTADKIGEYANYINGFDRKRAYGKINALKAVEMARDY